MYSLINPVFVSCITNTHWRISYFFGKGLLVGVIDGEIIVLVEEEEMFDGMDLRRSDEVLVPWTKNGKLIYFCTTLQPIDITLSFMSESLTKRFIPTPLEEEGALIIQIL